MKSVRYYFSFVIIAIVLTSAVLSNECGRSAESIFVKDNITPWCIVPFDAKNRTPQERAEMLQRLSFKTFAYDWRDVHISTFDEEVAELRKSGIQMTAFWWVGGLPKRAEDIYESEKGRLQMDFFKRNNLKLEVWVTLTEPDEEVNSKQEKYELAASYVDILAQELGKIGCRMSLYNHGGWGGEPVNMVEVIKRVKSKNTGLVYNFHHGHKHLDDMPEAFEMMVPYLTCVNLNGMNRDGPKILPLGEGEVDLWILKIIRDSGYKGPIGILGHVTDEDVEIVLKRNLDGLRSLLVKLGDKAAAKTYED